MTAILVAPTKWSQPRRLTLALVAAVLALCGCAGSPPRPLEVKIPVEVPCKAPDVSRPDFAVDSLPLGSGIWDQMKALRAERRQRQGYETLLESAVKACQ